MAEEFYYAGKSISGGSVVLPLNYSNNWYYSNYASYLGVEKEIILLDNYEVATPHFPLRWKRDFDPEIIGDFTKSSRPCINVDSFEEQTGKQIDYVSTFMKTELKDSCTVQVDLFLNKYFTEVIIPGQKFIRLFKRK